MVEQLSQRTALVGSSRLASIHGIESLVEEQADRPTEINPRWAVLIQSRRVPKEGEEITNNKGKARQRDLNITRQLETLRNV